MKLKMNLNTFANLETERLVLRIPSTKDLNDILFLRSDIIVNQYVKRPLTKNLQDAEDFLNRISNDMQAGKIIYWAITEKETDQMIGSICLWQFSSDGKKGEVGYDLKPQFHRKGIMSEALKAVLSFGFEDLKLERIEAYTQHDNQGSVQLLTNHNFKLQPERSDENNPANRVFLLSKTSF